MRTSTAQGESLILQPAEEALIPVKPVGSSQVSIDLDQVPTPVFS
jgi:hypothetical protein